MIEADSINLRYLEIEDIYLIKKWRNDPRVMSNVFSHTFISNLKQEKWFEAYTNDSSKEYFMIILKDTGAPIGVIGLSDIDHKNQVAILNTLIGEKEYWNKGFATEATATLLDYAYNELNLNRIESYSFENNDAIRKKNERFGFKAEGLLRQTVYAKGEFQDVTLMALLKEDWLQNKHQ